MELKIQRRGISVYGICLNGDEPIYVGRWERGSAIETKDGMYKAVDYGWLSDCLHRGNRLYAFGYYGLVLEGLRETKRVPMIGTYATTDGKLLYVAAENALSIYDYDLRPLGNLKVNGVRDVAVGHGVVYVLSRDALYVYSDGELKPVYKLSRDMGMAYYVLPDGDDIYVSALSGVVRLDAKTFRVKAFAPRVARTIAIIGNYLISFYDNMITVADRKTLSIEKRQLLNGITTGFAKARLVEGKVLVPAYEDNGSNVVLSVTLEP